MLGLTAVTGIALASVGIELSDTAKAHNASGELIHEDINVEITFRATFTD